MSTPTWLPFHCFGTPLWLLWHHLKLLCFKSSTNFNFWWVYWSMSLAGWKNHISWKESQRTDRWTGQVTKNKSGTTGLHFIKLLICTCWLTFVSHFDAGLVHTLSSSYSLWPSLVCYHHHHHHHHHHHYSRLFQGKTICSCKLLKSLYARLCNLLPRALFPSNVQKDLETKLAYLS